MDRFDEILAEMDGLEKEKSPLRLVFGFMKVLFKMFWMVIEWWIKSMIKMLRWLMRRSQPAQPLQMAR